MKIRPLLSVTAVGVLLALAACKQDVASLPARDHSQDGAVTPVSLTTASAETPKVDPRTLPVAKVAGKPMWAANKSHTAEENAQYQFEHHGGDFGSTTVAAYVDRAHSFAAHPPASAEKVTRSNGDTLIYDASSNIFAVVSKDGGPRTFFKPDSGASYWADQKKELAANDKDARPARKAATKSARPREDQG